MEDLIYRQEAIKALCKAGCDSGHCGVSCDDVKAIEGLPSADIDLSGFSDKLWETAYERGKAEAVRWIPCGERLPENDDSVLACYYDGEDQACAVAWHDGEEWRCWDDRIGFSFYVVAWMPLPAQYDSLQGAMNPPEDDIKTSMALLNSIADNAVRVATILQDMNEELKRAKK